MNECKKVKIGGFMKEDKINKQINNLIEEVSNCVYTADAIKLESV